MAEKRKIKVAPTEDSRSRSLSLVIFAVVAVSVISGGWYLTQIKKDTPDFSIPDISGTIVNLRDYSGEVVVLDFMATWCGPCRAAMRDLVIVHKDIGDQFVLISISVDPTHDTVPVLSQWADDFDADWIHARDLAEPRVTQQFGVTEIPTMVLIDRRGEIRYTHVGAVSALKLKTEILSLVNE